MAKQGQIADVGIAHRGDTEYLKAIPNGSQNDNLGNLPSVSSETQTSYLGRQHHSEVDGLFVYSNTKFEKVLPQLGRSYDVHYESRSLRRAAPCKMVVLNGDIFEKIYFQYFTGISGNDAFTTYVSVICSGQLTMLFP